MLAGAKMHWKHLFLILMAEENSLCNLQCYWGRVGGWEQLFHLKTQALGAIF